MHLENRYRVRDAVHRTSALALLLVAAGFVYTGLYAIAYYAWPEPMFDQYRLYADYIERPFPQNIIQLENGHRPIFPALIRVAEIHWLAADQSMQIAFGALFAFLTMLLAASAVWRDKTTLSLPIRASGVAAACMAVFWLANARMLLHGNELVHAYLLTLCVVAGSLAVQRVNDTSGLRWIGVATSCCVIATFCFGPGIALFPAVILLMALNRLPYRWMALPAATMVVTLVVYLWVLPGDGGVRGVLDFRPLDSIQMAARWIASPWINAWLGLADPPLHVWLADRADHDPILSALKWSANAGHTTLGIDWRTRGAFAIGIAGFTFVAFSIVASLARGRTPALAEGVGTGLALFGGATSLIIGVGRLGYLEANPDQIFADRYLIWPCLFWLGCALIAMCRLDRSATTRWGTVTVVVIAAVMLIPTHRAWFGWGATVSRISIASGAAARSNVMLAEHHPDDDAARWSHRLHALELFREHRLAMFAPDESRSLDQRITVEGDASPMELRIVRVDMKTDMRDGKPAGHVEGVVESGVEAWHGARSLAIVDAEQRVRGFLARSFVGYESTSMWKIGVVKRGFDGYIHDYSPETTYRIVVLDTRSGTASPTSATLSPAVRTTTITAGD